MIWGTPHLWKPPTNSLRSSSIVYDRSGDPCEEVTRGGPAVGEVAAVQRRGLSPVRAGVSW